MYGARCDTLICDLFVGAAFAIRSSSSSSFGRDPHLRQKQQQDSSVVELLNHPLFRNQMLAVLVFSQHRVSTSKTVNSLSERDSICAWRNKNTQRQSAGA